MENGHQHTPRRDLSPSHHPAPNFRWAFRILRTNRLWIFSVVLLASSITIMKHLREKDSFVSSSLLALDDHEQKQIFGGVPGLTNGDNFLPKVFSQVEQFRSPEVCKTVARVVWKGMTNRGVPIPHWARDPMAICGTLNFQPDTDRMQVRIVARSEDPFVSELIAGATAAVFINNDQRRLRRKISELKGFLGAQERELGSQLKSIESEKASFQSAKSIITGEQTEKYISDRLEQAEHEYIETQVLLKNNETLIAQVEKSLAELKGHLIEPKTNLSSFYLGQVQYRLNMLQYRKSTLKGTADASEIKKVDDEIGQIMKVYQNVIDGGGEAALTLGGDPIEYLKQLQGNRSNLLRDQEKLRARLTALSSTISKKDFELKDLATSLRRLGELNREHDLANNLYSVVKKRLQEIEIDEAGAVSDFAILSKSHYGYPENVPLWRKLIFSVGIGLFAIIAFLGLKEAFLPGIKDLGELEQLGVNAISYIPQVPLSLSGRIPILAEDHPHSLESDSFRALRFKLLGYKNLAVGKDRALVVLVTSPRPNAGKTFVACNLAVTMAQSGNKVLLIDLDLRNPSVLRCLAKNEIQGHLQDMTDNPLSELKEKYSDNLDVVVSNTVIDYAADFVERLNFPEQMRSLVSKYDVILVDAPPILSVVDLYLIIGAVDLPLLVVEHRKTHREDVIEAVESLNKVKKGAILGVVNKANPEIIFADHGRYYKVISSRDRAAS